jgi:cytochrome c biogenesis protein CcmG/thiol:disulfide interchange protein DsbE
VELPRLEPLYQKYKDKGLTVVAVEAQGDTEGATTFINENNLTYACLENGEGEGDVVRSLFGVRSFPTSYIIDRQGRIMFYHLGFDEGDEAKLEKEILQLL